MTTRYVSLGVHDGVARIVLDRPERANALSPCTVEALHEALTAVDDAGVGVVVLRARGRSFCGGLDLTDLDVESDADLLLRLVRVQLLLERVQSLEATTVAVVEGAAVGAGADLVLACAVRLALPAASLRFPGSGFGAVLGTARLAALTSPAYAAEVALTARRVPSDEAERRGLLRLVADVSEADVEVARLAASVARLPPGTAGRLRAAVSPPPTADPLGALVRSLAAPGLRDRVAAYQSRSRPTTLQEISS